MVGSDHDTVWPGTEVRERDALVERIARRICQYEGFGPDTLVVRAPPENGPPGTYIIRPKMEYPAWNSYARVADIALTVIEEGAG